MVHFHVKVMWDKSNAGVHFTHVAVAGYGAEWIQRYFNGEDVHKHIQVSMKRQDLIDLLVWVRDYLTEYHYNPNMKWFQRFRMLFGH